MHISEGQEKNMDQKIVQTVISRAFREDDRLKLSCRDAFSIAEENGVEPGAIGKICNEQNIRICKCQLGCFK
jgi:hypothetical protein